MFYQQPIAPGDLTSDLVEKYNQWLSLANNGPFTLATEVLDMTESQELLLVPQDPDASISLEELVVVVWSREANPSPTLPTISLGTNTGVNNVMEASTVAATLHSRQVFTVPATLVNVSAAGLKLKVTGGNYASFQAQLWLTGKRMEQPA